MSYKKIILFCLILNSCQGNLVNQKVRDELSVIQVVAGHNIEDADFCYYLRSLLRTKLNYRPKYLLTVKLKYDSDTFVLSKEEYKQELLKHTLSFQLQHRNDAFDQHSDKIILQDSIRLYNSNPIQNHPVISYTANNTNKEFLTRKAAEVLYYRLLLFFKKQYQDS